MKQGLPAKIFPDMWGMEVIKRVAMLFMALLLWPAVIWAQTPDPMLSQPLTLEAIADCEITFKNKGGDVKYKINGGAEETIPFTASGDGTSFVVGSGDVVTFYGDNGSYTQGANHSLISCTSDCYIYGNIMSLFSSTAYATAIAFNPSTQYVFRELFKDNTHIRNHSTKNLVLPATTLVLGCYNGMFSGCTGLTRAPALPATELANFCYQSMFSHCTGLTSAPALPATTLKYQCYYEMFKGCTGLTSAPALNATALETACYGYMFYGCTGLTSAPALPATALASHCYQCMFYGCTGLTSAPALNAPAMAIHCYQNMFYGCTGLTSAPALPATALADGCYYSMFEGCTGLTSAPALNATAMANYCYESMFEGCTGLTSAPALPATTLKDYSYKDMFKGCTNLSIVVCCATNISGETAGWLDGVAASGIFIKDPTVTSWPAGADGIPSGWKVLAPFTIQHYEEVNNWAALETALATTDSYIRLTADCASAPADNQLQVAAGKGIMLDLNGKTLTYNGADDAAIAIAQTSATSYGDLTILDTGTGGIVTGGDYGLDNAGKATLVSGAVTGSVYGVKVADDCLSTTLGGTASIDGTTADIYLPSGQVITIANDLDGLVGAPFSIKLSAYTVPQVITSGYGTYNNVAPSAYFSINPVGGQTLSTKLDNNNEVEVYKPAPPAPTTISYSSGDIVLVFTITGSSTVVLSGVSLPWGAENVSIPVPATVPYGQEYTVTGISAWALYGHPGITDVCLPDTPEPLAIEEGALDTGSDTPVNIHTSLRLLDNYALLPAVSQSYEAGRVSALVTAPNHYWTFSCGVDVVMPEGVTAYICKADGDEAVNILELKGTTATVDGVTRQLVKANNGVLLACTNGTGGDAYEMVVRASADRPSGMTPATHDEKSYEGNQLHPVIVSEHFEPLRWYIMKGNRFHELDPADDSAVPDCKAILPRTSAGQARQLSISVGEGTAGIRLAEMLCDGDLWYNLHGHRIDRPTQKGVYILNGKKVIIK